MPLYIIFISSSFVENVFLTLYFYPFTHNYTLIICTVAKADDFTSYCKCEKAYIRSPLYFKKFILSSKQHLTSYRQSVHSSCGGQNVIFIYNLMSIQSIQTCFHSTCDLFNLG